MIIKVSPFTQITYVVGYVANVTDGFFLTGARAESAFQRAQGIPSETRKLRFQHEVHQGDNFFTVGTNR